LSCSDIVEITSDDFLQVKIGVRGEYLLARGQARGHSPGIGGRSRQGARDIHTGVDEEGVSGRTSEGV
jgi:hypothetical protein